MSDITRKAVIILSFALALGTLPAKAIDAQCASNPKCAFFDACLKSSNNVGKSDPEKVAGCNLAWNTALARERAREDAADTKRRKDNCKYMTPDADCDLIGDVNWAEKSAAKEIAACKAKVDSGYFDGDNWPSTAPKMTHEKCEETCAHGGCQWSKK